MAHKRVMFRSAAREKILRGATQLADAIRVTLGPKSKSVLIQRKWGAPIVCNDGVTIAKEFDLSDGEENLGAQVLRQAAEKTGEIVGSLAENLGAKFSSESLKSNSFGDSHIGTRGTQIRPISTCTRHGFRLHRPAALPLRRRIFSRAADRNITRLCAIAASLCS